MSFFHSLKYYFERRWVPITNVQCILQMIKFKRPLKQKYDCILFYWLRGFGMVDYKTLHEALHLSILVPRLFWLTFKTHFTPDNIINNFTSQNWDIKKIIPWRELNPYLFCHVPSRELQQCQLSLSRYFAIISLQNFFQVFNWLFYHSFSLFNTLLGWLNVWAF